MKLILHLYLLCFEPKQSLVSPLTSVVSSSRLCRRSWNLYAGNVNQSLIMSQMTGVSARNRTVNGVPMSLADLGYNDVGLDGEQLFSC
jgi:hypothetical protein